jgi:DNA repair photolyase
MTRGFIRPEAFRALVAHRQYVKVTVGFTALDRRCQRLLEPLAAPPRLRLRQVRHLRQQGISVRASLEPLIPGLTDTRQNLAPLLQSLAAAGIGHVSAGYLFFRQGIQDNLLPALEHLGVSELVLDEFRDGPVLSAGAIAPARYLPKVRRQRGYAALMALAADHGITVSVSKATNSDFQALRKPASPPSVGSLLFMLGSTSAKAGLS